MEIWTRMFWLVVLAVGIVMLLQIGPYVDH
jgi:hypothetical protein